MTEQLRAAVLVVSDRIVHGEKDNTAGDLAKSQLEAAGCAIARTEVIAEGRQPLGGLLTECVGEGIDIIMVIGGTGIAPGNYTPEVSADMIAARLHGLETQVLMAGLNNSPKAGLSRAVIGMTDHGGGSLIINSASSTGAVRDTLGVVAPLFGDIFSCSRESR